MQTSECSGVGMNKQVEHGYAIHTLTSHLERVSWQHVSFTSTELRLSVCVYNLHPSDRVGARSEHIDDLNCYTDIWNETDDDQHTVR